MHLKMPEVEHTLESSNPHKSYRHDVHQSKGKPRIQLASCISVGVAFTQSTKLASAKMNFMANGGAVNCRTQ
jgi:hypothetical protein